MRRDVEPELLDDLRPGDPRAIESRADLRRLNFLMGHAGILSRLFCHQFANRSLGSQALRLVELGAGDGTLLLRLARRWSALGVKAEVTLLDRNDLVSAETRLAFARLDWPLQIVATDVFNWLEQPDPHVDVMIANLFLHHFPDTRLRELLYLAAARTNLFVACEPSRSPLALAASRSLWLIGCNATTRHDAALSVHAGFAGRELSALWPSNTNWVTNERSAGLFSHCFVASRNV